MVGDNSHLCGSTHDHRKNAHPGSGTSLIPFEFHHETLVRSGKIVPARPSSEEDRLTLKSESRRRSQIRLPRNSNRVSPIGKKTKGSSEGASWQRRPLRRRLLCLCANLLVLAVVAHAQQPVIPGPPDASPPAAQARAIDPSLASIHGVVVDKDGTVYEGAHVALNAAGNAASAPAPATATDSNGQFNFPDVPPGAFTLTFTSKGFATQKISGTLHPGENFDAKSIVMVMSAATSEVDVTATSTEIATEELKLEETQRVLGVIPNFYVTYVPNAPPLTAKQKYNLALKSSIDPVALLAVGFFAGIEQANNSFSGYGQGAQGYAKRYGAGFADSFIGTMIGGAILPAWWKQDPRYFYKGTGTKRSRVLYAVAAAVVCKGDNGHWQPNYSAIVGGLAAGGISNLYYPASNRNGAALTFENALVDTGLGAVGNLFQEFVVRKLTPKVPNYSPAKP